MAYYLLIEAEVLKPEQYAVYREAVTPIIEQYGEGGSHRFIEQYGGRFWVRGARWSCSRGSTRTIARCGDRIRLQGGGSWLLDGREYAPVKKPRDGAGVGGVIGVGGGLTGYLSVRFRASFLTTSHPFPVDNSSFQNVYILYHLPQVRRMGASSCGFSGIARTERRAGGGGGRGGGGRGPRRR